MVNSDSDDWLKAGGDVAYKLWEDLIDENIADDQVHAQHDRYIEDADEVLTSEQAEYASHWVEVELAAAEEVTKDHEVDGQAKVVDE